MEENKTVFGNLASVEVVHKLDLDLKKIVAIAAIYAGFRILEYLVVKALK